MLSKLRRGVKMTSVFTMGSGCVYMLYDYNSRYQLQTRNLRTLWTGMKLVYNYKVKLNVENVDEVHEQVAKDLYNLCIKNDGLYVKFG